MNVSDAAESFTYRALDFRFQLRGSLEPTLRPLFASMLETADDYRPKLQNTIAPTGIEIGSTGEHGKHHVAIDSDVVFETFDLGALVHQTVWEITRRAIALHPTEVVLHAAAVVFEGCIVLISGASGAGKSTLTSALLDEGGTYLTDEAVRIDASGRVCDAIARPIHLSRRSLDLLRLELPSLAVRMPGGGAYLPTFQLAPPLLPHSTVVVALGDHDHIGTQEESRRSATVATLIRESFPPAATSAAGLTSVKHLVVRSQCTTLRGGSVTWRASCVKSFVTRKPSIA